MRFRTAAGLFALLSLLAAPATVRAQEAPVAQMPSVTVPPEIERVLRDYEAGWRAGDEEALAALFTEDGFVLQNGRPPVRGREAIRQAYAQAQGPLYLRALSYAADDTVGYIIGAFASTEGGPDGGKFILALRREPDGRWMIAGDIDNGNQMPRRPPQATPVPPQL